MSVDADISVMGEYPSLPDTLIPSDFPKMNRAVDTDRFTAVSGAVGFAYED